MEINPTDCPLHLVKANIVESLKAGARDGPNPVVRHEEMLFPSHENMLALGDVLHDDLRRSGRAPRLLGVWTESRELGPVGKVGAECGAPVSVTGGECVFMAAYDFAFEISREGRVVVSETLIETWFVSTVNLRNESSFLFFPTRATRSDLPWMRR